MPTAGLKLITSLLIVAWTPDAELCCPQEGRVGVAMAEASFEYTFEYQGNAPKLVYTPLTDKCYLTLTQVN